MISLIKVSSKHYVQLTYLYFNPPNRTVKTTAKEPAHGIQDARSRPKDRAVIVGTWRRKWQDVAGCGMCPEIL